MYGNPDLERALIDNIDARWEWYPALERPQLRGLYKNFTQPIESIIVVSAQHSVTYQMRTPLATLGLRDFRKTRLSGTSPEDVYLAGNASWIDSRVRSANSGIQTSDERALQGQSPHVYNLQTGHDHPEGSWGSPLSTMSLAHASPRLERLERPTILSNRFIG